MSTSSVPLHWHSPRSLKRKYARSEGIRWTRSCSSSEVTIPRSRGQRAQRWAIWPSIVRSSAVSRQSQVDRHQADTWIGPDAAENKLLIVRLGGLEPLIRQMLSPNVEVQCNAVGCITNLATHGESMARRGGLESRLIRRCVWLSLLQTRTRPRLPNPAHWCH